jgi:3',5'-cyclic-AMP phosphodiesterase
MHIRASLEATLLGVNTAQYFQKVIQHAFANHNFDLVLITGDLAQDPCPASYEFIRTQLAAYNTPCICLPGNHDDYDMMQQAFNTDAINCRKQVLLNNWQLISLNSQIIGANGGYLSDEELAFLDACLTEKPNHYALIAAHHHCLETQSTWMDTMMIENRYGLFTVIDKHPQVQAIVYGHIHQRMETQKASVQVLATPSTCFQFKPKAKEFALDDSSPGYRIIELYADGHIESDVVRLSEPLSGLQMNMHGY